MTCTFCGSVLEDNEVECPYCGHKTAQARYSEPVEEYDDEFEPEEPEGQDQEYVEPVRTERRAAEGSASKSGLNIPKLDLKKLSASVKRGSSQKEKAAPARSKTQEGRSHNEKSSFIPFGGKLDPSFISLIGFVACALLSVICLISVSGVNKKIEQVNQNILSQVYQLQTSNQKISERLDELGNTVGTVSNTISEQTTSKNINITKEPTSAATYLGRGGTDDSTQNVPIFSVSATGPNLTFAWQKYDEASASWVNIVFDAESNNDTYGLHIYTDISKGYSELAAHGVKNTAYGSYRCLISDDYGSKATETVVLTQRDNT